MTRIESLGAALAGTLDRMAAEGMIPLGYEGNIILRHKSLRSSHILVGQSTTGDLSDAISELHDNPARVGIVNRRGEGISL